MARMNHAADWHTSLKMASLTASHLAPLDASRVPWGSVGGDTLAIRVSDRDHSERSDGSVGDGCLAPI